MSHIMPQIVNLHLWLNIKLFSPLQSLSSCIKPTTDKHVREVSACDTHTCHLSRDVKEIFIASFISFSRLQEYEGLHIKGGGETQEAATIRVLLSFHNTSGLLTSFWTFSF